MSLYVYISISLYLFISISLYPYVSISLYLYISISLYIYMSACQCQDHYISICLYPYISISIYLYLICVPSWQLLHRICVSRALSLSLRGLWCLMTGVLVVFDIMDAPRIHQESCISIFRSLPLESNMSLKGNYI